MIRRILLVLGILLVLLAMYGISGEPEVIQAVMPVGEKKKDISEITCAVRQVTSQETVSTETGTSAAAQVYAVNAIEGNIYPRFLESGCWFYQEETREGSKVCVIEEPLSIELFTTGDAVGKEVLLNHAVYPVIGVLRTADRLGRSAEHRIYIPYDAYDASGDYLVYSAGTFPLEEDSFDPGGTQYSLRKEKIRAMLFPRYLLAAMLFILLHRYRRWLKKRFHSLLEAGREDLKHCYLREIRGKTMIASLGMVLLAACWAVGVYGVLSFCVQPAYDFPEWIPQVLVEPDSVRETFWSLMRSSSDIQLRTQEVRRLYFFGMLSNFGCVLILLAMMDIRKVFHGKAGASGNKWALRKR